MPRQLLEPRKVLYATFTSAQIPQPQLRMPRPGKNDALGVHYPETSLHYVGPRAQFHVVAAQPQSTRVVAVNPNAVFASLASPLRSSFTFSVSMDKSRPGKRILHDPGKWC